MNAATSDQVSDVVSSVAAPERFPSRGTTPAVLADIFRRDINIAIWQRKLDDELRAAVATFLASNPQFETLLAVSPDDALGRLRSALGRAAPTAFVHNIADLVYHFCSLLELGDIRLRLATLDRAMCPRFHVDMLHCRLLTTYHGAATEWLPHAAVDRSKLGPRSSAQSDLAAGLYRSESDIQRLNCGDVALLKGERWAGNANAGLVHRSPQVPEGKRLLLTLDVGDWSIPATAQPRSPSTPT
ncbi:MAG: DUF1826 domain-containing protein [Pseudomonadota bacterium]